MIHTSAASIAHWIKRESREETASLAVMTYALSIFISTTLIVTASLLIGWVADTITQTIVSLITVGLLRIIVGGYHYKSMDVCFVVSTCICAGIPVIVYYIGLGTIVSLVLLLIGIALIQLLWTNPYQFSKHRSILFRFAILALPWICYYLDFSVMSLSIFSVGLFLIRR